MGDHFAFIQSSYSSNFFKGYTIGPGSPNNPVGTVFGWFQFFDPGDRVLGLLRFHSLRISEKNAVANYVQVGLW